LIRKEPARAGISNRLIIVRDGQTAIDYLAGAGKFVDRAEHPLPCLALLDLKMPLRTGLEAGTSAVCICPLEFGAAAPTLIGLVNHTMRECRFVESKPVFGEGGCKVLQDLREARFIEISIGSHAMRLADVLLPE